MLMPMHTAKGAQWCTHNTAALDACVHACMQVFVETLDKCFENVCELDLIFHCDRVYYVLDEIVMGGLVLETNMTEILAAVQALNKVVPRMLIFMCALS